jgi:hypothetical protein
MVTNVKRNIKASTEKEYMKQYGPLYYQEHKNEIIKRSHDQYLRNREKLLAGRHARYLRDKDDLSELNQKQYYEVRKEILKLLGRKCIRCGFSDLRALQIDHINGNGRKEVKSFPNSFTFYKYVLKQIQSGSKDYQCLCANCNQIKRYENKEGMTKKFRDMFLE